MSRLSLAQEFPQSIPSRLFRHMPLTQVMVAFSSNVSTPLPLNKLSVFIQEYGLPFRLIIILLKKEILSIVLCISKFQSDLLNQKFLIRVDCKSAKHVLEKNVQNIASKQIFARWQAILSVFDFDIKFIEGTQNNIPNFLTREFLQSLNQDVREETCTT